MEVLKQPQFSPLSVEKQVLIIFAGTGGYLDDLDVELVRPFETELYRFVENAHPDILREIREKKSISDELRERIKALLAEFKERFVTEHGK
jgi:F-type H+-transporting ATPase subunit alpha